jgi:hypothetical protein
MRSDIVSRGVFWDVWDVESPKFAIRCDMVGRFVRGCGRELMPFGKPGDVEYSCCRARTEGLPGADGCLEPSASSGVFIMKVEPEPSVVNAWCVPEAATSGES